MAVLIPYGNHGKEFIRVDSSSYYIGVSIVFDDEKNNLNVQELLFNAEEAKLLGEALIKAAYQKENR